MREHFQEPILSQIFIPLPHGLSDLEWIKETEECHATTLGVSRQAIRWAKRNGLNKLFVVCADVHGRCERDLLIAAKEVRYPVYVETIFVDTVWSKDAIQKHVRSEEAWWGREVLIGSLPILIYRWLCG